MTTALRQRALFNAEDWKIVYQAFTSANFTAYDFQTIRDAMVDYIRINFPEDFSDWLESSELVALIELLAYLGQSLSFRLDLNTRENFIDTAERRDSVLRLARTLSYSPSRNQAANGLVKLNNVTTNQTIHDSNGQNLANQNIIWNDPTNPDWFEQFILVLNAGLQTGNQFGNPSNSGLVSRINTQTYTFNNVSRFNNCFPFSATVNSQSLDFEIVNVDFRPNESFFEKSPDPATPFNIVYRNDGKGNSSADTGFFFYFKQGTMINEDYNITNPIENRLINLRSGNINNDDLWFQEIDSDGLVIEEWSKVPALVGNNIIFNSIEKNIRKIYSTVTRENDEVSIRFADGRFGQIPVGLFRTWYRVSANSRFTIRPDDMRNVKFNFSYYSGPGNKTYNMSFNCSLQRSISNSFVSETTQRIKTVAPQVYYTQDRMVNGEDYSIYPLKDPRIAKIKSVNRIHSGFSRYIDINDPTGSSQNLSLLGEDGLIYLNNDVNLIEIQYPSQLSSSQIVSNHIVPQLSDYALNQFFYFNYPQIKYDSSNNVTYPYLVWKSASNATNSGTGFFEYDNQPVAIGKSLVGTTEYHIDVGSLIEFENKGWVGISKLINNGTIGSSNGDGAISLSEIVQDGDKIKTIIPPYPNNFTIPELTQVANFIDLKTAFGIRYDTADRTWKIITGNNINIDDKFSLAEAGNISGEKKDASWILRVEFTQDSWRVYTRTLEYIFESENEIKFYFSNTDNIVDLNTGKKISDHIKILDVNSSVEVLEDEIIIPVITINTNPNSENTYNNSPVQFSVMATIDPVDNLYYQWQFQDEGTVDWIDITGEISNTLSIPNATWDDVGKYRVIVSGDGDVVPVISNEAELSIVASPEITIIQQPINIDSFVGNDIQFSVIATVSPNNIIYYQWQFREEGSSTWVNISGGEDAILSINAASMNDVGDYRVTVSSASASNVISTIAYLELTEEAFISIINQPDSVDAFTGDNAEFNVLAVISPSDVLSYQWQFREYGTTIWDDLVGETGDALLLSNVASNNIGHYRVIVSSPSAESVISNVEYLQVSDPIPVINITIQPIGSEIDAGDPLNLSVTANVSSGFEPITYQWQFLDELTGNWNNKAGDNGGTLSTFVISNSLISDTGHYRVILNSLGAESVISETIHAKVNDGGPVIIPVITILQQPENVEYDASDPLPFFTVEAIAEPANTLTYDWEWRMEGSSTWDMISEGSSDPDLVLSQVDYGEYRVTIHSPGANSVISNIATLTEYIAPPIITITSQPTDTFYDSFPALGSMSVTATVDPVGPLTYQWQFLKSFPLPWETGLGGSPASWTNVSGIEGPNSPSLTYSSVIDGNNNESLIGSYRVVISSPGADDVTSDIILWEYISGQVNITTQPVNVIDFAGGPNPTFTVAAEVIPSSKTLEYSWERRLVGQSIWIGVGTDSTTFTDDGKYVGAEYRARAEIAGEGYHYALSDVVTFQDESWVEPEITIIQQPVFKVNNNGDDVIEVIAVIDPSWTLSYHWQWKKLGSDNWINVYGNDPVQGGEGQNGEVQLMLNGFAPNAFGDFRVIVSSRYAPSVISNEVHFEIIAVPEITIETQTRMTYYAPGYADVEVIASVNTASSIYYQWQYSVDGNTGWYDVGINSTDYWLEFNNYDETDLGFYRAILTSSGTASVISNPVELVMDPPPSITIFDHPEDYLGWPGDDVYLSVYASVNGDYDLMYQWQFKSQSSDTIWFPVENGNNDFLSYPDITYNEMGIYRVVVSAIGLTSVVSDTAEIFLQDH